MPNALDILPKPLLVEEFIYDEILNHKINLFLAAHKAETGVDFTALTESSLVVRLIRSSAEDEYNQRQRTNERYRARFVYFSEGENLKILMREEGLEPADGETTERRQERIRLQRIGSSAAGPLEWYRRKAIEVAPDEIEDISVDFPDQSTVLISILAKTPDGLPSDDLVERIRAVLTSDEVHPDDHTQIIVRGAEAVDRDVHAIITLEPDTDIAVFNALQTYFEGAFAGRRGLGRDITNSWIIGQLQQSGIHKVENLSVEAAPVLPYQVARLSSLNIVLADGRDY